MVLQERLDEILACDIMVASGFLNVAEFWGLAGGLGRNDSGNRRRLPTILMLHENQLTYPTRTNDERDNHFAVTNIVSGLAAEEIWFNSAFHRDEFFEAVPIFLRQMPDARPKGVAEALSARSRVMHLGVRSPLPDHAEFDAAGLAGATNKRLRIGWNHRWEFDKGPETFFEALDALQERTVDFEVAVFGEKFRVEPDIFLAARKRLERRIVHWGFVEKVDEYGRLLASCDVVVSTAVHEFFGLSVVEAARCGCALLLPRRLSYPELFTEDGAEEGTGTFYDDPMDLVRRLAHWAEDLEKAKRAGGRVRKEAKAFDWRIRGPEFDEACSRIFRDHALNR